MRHKGIQKSTIVASQLKFGIDESGKGDPFSNKVM